ncbi:hypothetical protein AB0H57_05465 [Micromonospora sp. NPDC050686]|uniref:hypothetical protein n=1 Tax=Micromonospora sp. NPDC050686 TaxID=3154631 RepID=UPI0033F9BBA3
MLGDVVHYTFDAAQAEYVRLRGKSTGVSRFPYMPDPVAGTTLPAEVIHEYGGGVVDLRVSLRGPGIHLVQNVAQGTAGQQGRWAVRA